MFGNKKEIFSAVLIPLIVAGFNTAHHAANVSLADVAKNDTKLLGHYPWLTSDLFLGIVRQANANREVSIVNFIGYESSKPGENYEVTELNVTVNYKIDGEQEVYQLALIVYAAKVSQLSSKTVEYKRFEKEIFAYKEIIPNAEKLLLQIGDDTKLAARLLAADAQAPYIILENLARKGYRMLDRRFGLDVPHFEATLSKLAKFHATTAVLHLQKHPCMVNGFVNNPKPEKFIETDRGVRFALQSIKEMAKTTAGYEKISKKLDNIGDTLYTASQESVYPSNETFNALMHMDIWVTKLMFADQRDAPIDALIQNFGGIKFGPIVYDLLYSFFTSSQEDLDEKDWDRLLQNYYYVFKNTLLKLKYPVKKIPTLTEIHVQCLKRGRGLVLRGIMDLAMNVYNEANMETSKAMLNDGERDRRERLKMLTNQDAEKGLNVLIDYFDRKGFLD